MALDIELLLKTLLIKQASDLHLQVGYPPYLRINGEIKVSNLPALTEADMQAVVDYIMTEEEKEIFKKELRLDMAYTLPEVSRFRANFYYQRGFIGASLRVIPCQIRTIDELGLPFLVKDLCRQASGLIIVSGPTGSGKSTTQAAMIDYINETRPGHIITIEDPIEFLHSQNKQCTIDQRQLGTDTHSYADALRDALRQDPDVVLLGEMRDLETMAMAIRAAETGILVISTLHTFGAAPTVDRIVDVFPSHQQSQIRLQLSMVLKAVISQTLIRKKDGTGRVAAFELMLVTPAIANLIREAKTFQIHSHIATGQEYGMQTLDMHLEELVKQGVVSLEDALNKATNRQEFKLKIKGDVSH